MVRWSHGGRSRALIGSLHDTVCAVSVVVVLPTYNEAENVRRVITDLSCTVTKPSVLVVDDSSPDGTAGVVREMMAEHPQLSLLERRNKTGLGAAYVSGFQAVLDLSGVDVIVQMDADGSHGPADLDRLVAALDAADLAIGSRYVGGGGVEGWPWYRRSLSVAGNWYAKRWLSRGIADWTGGFKAWRADCLRKMDLATVQSDGYAFQVELTARALGSGARVVELPITFGNRTIGQSKMSAAIAVEAVRVIPRLRRYAS